MGLKFVLSFFLSLGLMLLIMPHFIDYMKRLSFNQSVSEYSLEEYKAKAKTPIMGGVLFITIPVLVTFVLYPQSFGDLSTMVVLLAFVGYGAIGFLDDWLIVIKQNNEGLKPWQKFGLQLILAAIFYLAYRQRAGLWVSVPFTDYVWRLGRFYVILILFMFTGSSNAVNITDGMDGLAGGCSIFALLPFCYFAYTEQIYGLFIFLVALEGALVGYLRFNKNPAQIFMGDTGSLALGALLAACAMILKKELALVVIAGVFVIETVCVILQISSVKLRGKKIFRYTPIHYAFVLDGYSERKVVRMFWIGAALFAAIGLWVGFH